MKKYLALLLTVAMFLSIFPAGLVYAADELQYAFDQDGDLYTFYVKNASQNSVFSVNLEPVQSGEEQFYVFNPTALGLEIKTEVSYAFPELGSGAPCPVVRLSAPLPGCCGIVVYALLSEGSQAKYRTALICDTNTDVDALVYSDGFSRIQQDKLLLVNALSRGLYDRDEAEIKHINAFAIISDYEDAAAGPIDCKIEEINLDSLTLYFETGEQACECLTALVKALGIPEKKGEDYYYTDNGVDYWFIPAGKTRDEAVCVSPMELGYYAVNTYDCGSRFFYGDTTSELVSGDSSVYYMAFAEPVSDCVGIISSAKLTMIGMEEMSKYIWGIGVKETPTQKWFFMDYFDYVGAAQSGDWQTVGLIFPSEMQVDGLIVCPMEYFKETFIMQYPGTATLLFADGKAAMRFMRQLEAYPMEPDETENAAPVLNRETMMNVETFRKAYGIILAELAEVYPGGEEKSDLIRNLSITDKPEIDPEHGTILYYNSEKSVCVSALFIDPKKTDTAGNAQLLTVMGEMQNFDIFGSLIMSYVAACDSSVDLEEIRAWVLKMKEEKSEGVFDLDGYTLIYQCLADGAACTFALGETPEKIEAPTKSPSPVPAIPLSPTQEPPPKPAAAPGTMEWKVSGDTITISGNAPMPDYTSTTPPWVSYKDSVKHLIIEPGITHVGSQCFQYFSNLESVSLPSTLTSIGNAAFFRCEALREIMIPGTVKSLGNQVFDHCITLRSVIIPDGVPTLGDAAFNCCEALESITIPKSVTRIGDSAFNGCYALKDVFYGGSASDWARIDIDIYNKRLTGAAIHTVG